MTKLKVKLSFSSKYSTLQRQKKLNVGLKGRSASVRLCGQITTTAGEGYLVCVVAPLATLLPYTVDTLRTQRQRYYFRSEPIQPMGER